MGKKRTEEPPGPHYIVFDTETTGFPSKRPGCPVRGIQFGFALVSLKRGAVVETWSRMVRPGVWASSAPPAEEVHGLSRGVVEAHGVAPAKCWGEIEQILAVWAAVAGVGVGQVPMLAWNAPFDTQILHRLGVDAGVLAPSRLSPLPDARVPAVLHSGALSWADAPGGCLMRAYGQWARSLGLSSEQGLDAARSTLGLLARTGNHDAGTDAAMAGEVLLAMGRPR